MKASHLPVPDLPEKNGHDLVVTERDGRMLTRPEFFGLADVPAEMEWFANIDNAQTRRAYQSDMRDFMGFSGVAVPTEFRIVTRSHVIAWRKSLEERTLSASTIRRKLAALSSLFEYLCEKNAVNFNPVKGAKRPPVESYEGKTPALGDHQARALLAAPDVSTLKGKRDAAMLSVFLFHGLRREELCNLKVRDVHLRRGVLHLRVHGKGGKLRHLPLHPATAEAVDVYLEAAGHRAEAATALFRSMYRADVGSNGSSLKGITPDGVYSLLAKYAKLAKIDVQGFGPHSLRATAATNALDHEADIAKVQELLGHSNIQTTKLYDRRRSRPEDSATFRIAY